MDNYSEMNHLGNGSTRMDPGSKRNGPKVEFVDSSVDFMVVEDKHRVRGQASTFFREGLPDSSNVYKWVYSIQYLLSGPMSLSVLMNIKNSDISSCIQF